MHDSSLDRVALSENLTFYMTTLRAANENIKHRNDNVYRLQNIYKSTLTGILLLKRMFN